MTISYLTDKYKDATKVRCLATGGIYDVGIKDVYFRSGGDKLHFYIDGFIEGLSSAVLIYRGKVDEFAEIVEYKKNEEKGEEPPEEDLDASWDEFLPKIEKRKPEHYDREEKIDVIDFAKVYDLNFNEGNVVKYVARAGAKLYPEKTPLESKIIDLEKAKDYIEREIDYLSRLKR